MRAFHYEATVTKDQIDVLGHLNNAAYLAIFEAARWAVFGDTGGSWEAVTRTGVAPVILDVALHFRQEVRLGDLLRIETQYTALSPRRFMVHQKMRDSEGQLRAFAELQGGFMDIHARRIATPPPALLEALGLAGPLPAAPVVQGLGGAFLYANDVDALAAWYTEHLGLTLEHWGKSRGVELPSADRVPSTRIATTTFALFQADAPLPPTRTGRVNLRVAELDTLLERLIAAGQRVERGPEEYGRFAWVWDPEGNQVELWEPPRG